MGEKHEEGQRPSARYAALIAAISRLPTIDEQRVRWARRTANQLVASGSGGFTLLELLAVIVILGILGGITSLAVGSLQQQAHTGACLTDRSTLVTALEAYRLEFGAYGSQPQLVSAGLLYGPMNGYDVAIHGDNYTLTPQGSCADIDTTSTTTTTAPPTTTSSPSPTTTTTTTTTTAPPPTTTVAPTTTTAPPPTTTAPVVDLTLSSACTPSSHWPEERAWQIHNPSSVAVQFTLEELYVSNGPDNPITDSAPPGDSTWYLPAASFRMNVATLDSAGDSSWGLSTNHRC